MDEAELEEIQHKQDLEDWEQFEEEEIKKEMGMY